MKPLKIGVVCYPTYGGSGIVATQLASLLAARGHEIHLISHGMPVRLGRHLPNLYLHEVPSFAYSLFHQQPYALSLASCLAEVTEEAGLNLYHAHYAIPHAVAAHLAREMLPHRKIGLVTTLHGTDITLVGGDPSYYMITKFAIDRSDAVTCVSNYLRDETVRRFETKRPIDVIYNFVTDEFVQSTSTLVASTLLAPSSVPILAHVSNFRPVKRAPEVVRVFAEVRKRMPARLILVGDGPDMPNVRDVARQLGVMNDILLLGNQESLQDILVHADIFLMPSENESFGLAALEAMACRTAVLASRIGGLPEVIDDGVSGFLFDLGDIASMGRKAVGLLTEPAELDAVKENAQRRALTAFSAHDKVDAYEAVYRRILGG
jgi:N-acetyl-alpha-D-glucosaminyl L-malate synthase BshA